MLPELSLEGRSAIVTGAGSGIGREIALVLAEAGVGIVAADRATRDNERTVADVTAMGTDAIAVTTDVAKSSDVDTMVDRALEHFGKVDILVNDAGVLLRLPVAPFPDSTLEPPEVDRESTSRTGDAEWQRIFQTNVDGVFYCCRAVAPHMMESGYGKVINVSSINAIKAFPLAAAYCASKAAVSMLTKVLALEWAPYNICVNAIGPGFYRTAMTEPGWVNPEDFERDKATVPFQREGNLRELGVLTAYLASPASDYMTGQVIYMDGGLTAR